MRLMEFLSEKHCAGLRHQRRQSAGDSLLEVSTSCWRGQGDIVSLLFQRSWEHDGFQQVLVDGFLWVLDRQDAPKLVEAAPDRRNNAHLVLHPIEDLHWRSRNESQKYAKTAYELGGL